MAFRWGAAKVLGWIALGLAASGVVFTVVFLIASGTSFAEALDSYAVSNLAIGGSFAAAGAVIALHRPGNPIGWIVLLGGLGTIGTAASVPIGMYAEAHHAPTVVMRLLATVFYLGWPWTIGLALPLMLALFPTGRTVSPRWRPAIWFTLAAGLLFVLFIATDPTPVDVASPEARTYLVLPGYHRLDALWVVANFAPLGALILAVWSLVVRYRRGGEVLRRQLLWLVFASIAAIAMNVPRSLFGDAPILLLFAFTLVPAAVAVAILRYQLLDIRLVLSRTVLYLLLTFALAGTYLGGAALADNVVRSTGAPLVTTLIIALLFNPARVRLQHAIDRLFYGSRHDPVSAMSQVGARLATDDLTEVLSATRNALALPYAAMCLDGREIAAAGTRPARVRAVPLQLRDDRTGELVVGLRRGDSRLTAADLDILQLLAAPLAGALRATALADELQAARRRLVNAREEDRRRLHRDLHDGLGPTLTGAGFKADAAGNLLTTAPLEARALILALREDIGSALIDVRRVVYELRPAALDELGLAGAVAQHGTGLLMQVTVNVPRPLPALTAAVEMAAYRIVIEALTNITRHAGATAAHVEITADAALHLTISDNGTRDGPWLPGIGLTSIHDRAAELGGTATVGPTGTGGLVTVMLPITTKATVIA